MFIDYVTVCFTPSQTHKSAKRKGVMIDGPIGQMEINEFQKSTHRIVYELSASGCTQISAGKQTVRHKMAALQELSCTAIS